MTQPKTSRIPAPIYAAAGAGDLALQQLRRLPAIVNDLRGRVVTDLGGLGGRVFVTGEELRQRATETLRTANLTAAGLREKAVSTDFDLEKLRDLATRNAAVFLTGAQVAQQRALAAYGVLVARGERVVGAGVLEAAETVNADIETTRAATAASIPAVQPDSPSPTGDTEATTPATSATPADVAEVADARPTAAKRARVTKAAATPSAKLPKPSAGGTASTAG